VRAGGPVCPLPLLNYVCGEGIEVCRVDRPGKEGIKKRKQCWTLKCFI
jgi:hypothetical protein